MTTLDYIKNYYDEDLTKFYNYWPADIIPYLSGEVIVQKALEADINNTSSFLITAYIELLLLRSVGIYNASHFQRYHTSLRFYEKLGSISDLVRIRNPQKMFANLTWKKNDCLHINENMIAVLPLWTKQYDYLIKEEGAGKKIINNLQYDKYIFEDTDKVSSEILQAIKVGVFGAAQALGILYLFQKPRYSS